MTKSAIEQAESRKAVIRVLITILCLGTYVAFLAVTLLGLQDYFLLAFYVAVGLPPIVQGAGLAIAVSASQLRSKFFEDVFWVYAVISVVLLAVGGVFFGNELTYWTVISVVGLLAFGGAIAATGLWVMQDGYLHERRLLIVVLTILALLAGTGLVWGGELTRWAIIGAIAAAVFAIFAEFTGPGSEGLGMFRHDSERMIKKRLWPKEGNSASVDPVLGLLLRAYGRVLEIQHNGDWDWGPRRESWKDDISLSVGILSHLGQIDRRETDAIFHMLNSRRGYDRHPQEMREETFEVLEGLERDLSYAIAKMRADTLMARTSSD